MEQHDVSTAFVYVLRRIPPAEVKGGAIQLGAFVLHKDEPGLSVYDPSLAKPRRLLQDYVNSCQKRLQSPDETEAVRTRAAKNLERYGTTVEELYENGWRVAHVPVAAFLEQGLTVEPPDPKSIGDQIGHRNVPGSNKHFRSAAPDLA